MCDDGEEQQHCVCGCVYNTFRSSHSVCLGRLHATVPSLAMAATWSTTLQAIRATSLPLAARRRLVARVVVASLQGPTMVRPTMPVDRLGEVMAATSGVAWSDDDGLARRVARLSKNHNVDAHRDVSVGRDTRRSATATRAGGDVPGDFASGAVVLETHSAQQHASSHRRSEGCATAGPLRVGLSSASRSAVSVPSRLAILRPTMVHALVGFRASFSPGFPSGWRGPRTRCLAGGGAPIQLRAGRGTQRLSMRGHDMSVRLARRLSSSQPRGVVHLSSLDCDGPCLVDTPGRDTEPGASLPWGRLHGQCRGHREVGRAVRWLRGR